MGTLPIIHLKKFRLMMDPSTQLPVSSTMFILLIALVLGLQVNVSSCSGGVNLASSSSSSSSNSRPYLFRDFGMPTGQAPPPLSAHAQIANLYHSHQLSQIKKSSSSSSSQPFLHLPTSHSTGSYLEYFDDIIGSSSSSEEDPGLQYTAPLIIDIDDPDKARWIEFNNKFSGEQDDDDVDVDYVEEGEYEPGSISSTEFQSRSGLALASTTPSKPKSEITSQQLQKKEKSDSSSSSRSRSDNKNDDGDKRGIMDYLGNFWQANEFTANSPSSSSIEMPQDDGEIPFFDYQQYAYLPYGHYDFDQQQLYQQYFESLAPSLVNANANARTPKPLTASQKPKQKAKPKKKQKVAKPKPKKRSKPVQHDRPRPRRPVQRRPSNLNKKRRQQQLPHHDNSKLSIMKEKLSQLNPFRYVPSIQIPKPQMNLQKPPGGGGGGRPPPGKKPQRLPPLPMRLKNKLPSILPLKLKRPQKPQKPPQKREEEEEDTAPEFITMIGQHPDLPLSDQSGENSQEETVADDGNEEGEDEDEEADDDDGDDNDDDEEEEAEYDYPQQQQQVQSAEYEVVAQEAEDGDDGEVAVLNDDDDGDYAEEADADDAETEAALSDDETILLAEDDDEQGPYEDSTSSDLFGNYAEPNHYGATRNTPPSALKSEEESSPEHKEKSIGLLKSFGWRRRKKYRRRPKPKPARRPPHWKKYRPAPLLPEVPEGLTDALLTVVKNVGFLPEYGKDEKYGGGHKKYKGKFTKTRPITLHHGLLTEVLRRR